MNNHVQSAATASVPYHTFLVNSRLNSSSSRRFCECRPRAQLVDQLYAMRSWAQTRFSSILMRKFPMATEFCDVKELLQRFDQYFQSVSLSMWNVDRRWFAKYFNYELHNPNNIFTFFRLRQILQEDDANNAGVEIQKMRALKTDI